MGLLARLSNWREAAHSLVAVLGALAASGALVVGLLAAFGVHGLDVQVAQFAGICGAAAVLISKGVDSLNNAVTMGYTAPDPNAKP